MSDDKSIESAKKAVQHILASLSIGMVVYVDDENSVDDSIEVLLSMSSGMDVERLEALFPGLTELIDDEDIRKDQIESHLKSITSEQRKALIEKIQGSMESAEKSASPEEFSTDLLAKLIPAGSLMTLKPSEWEIKKDELISSCGERKTIFLFDQDLSKDGGTPTEGMRIIGSLLADPKRELMCGLISNSVSEENQYEKWITFSQDGGINKDRFIVIPKEQVCSDPIRFAEALKVASLTPDFHRFKESIKEIIGNAKIHADKELDKVSLSDLDHIVFRTSFNEGMWEPDMLIRLHNLFHRLESRRLANTNGSLEKLAFQMRTLSNTPGKTARKSSKSLWDLQKLELYEKGEHINAHHLPIELGDIFTMTPRSETEGVPRTFILLAQPCDLMIRQKGIRARAPDKVPLVEIVRFNENAEYCDEIDFFGENPSDRWMVRYKGVRYVNVCILDMCVYNSDGVSKISIPSTDFSGLRPFWQERLKAIEKEVLNVIKSSNILGQLRGKDSQMQEVRSKLDNLLFKDGPFYGTVERDGSAITLTYNCKRISRLHTSRSTGLLSAFLSTLGRPAYDTHFAPKSVEDVADSVA